MSSDDPAIDEKLAESIAGIELTDDDRAEHEGVFLFASFDLINSTRYKRACKGRWPPLMRCFYDTTRNYVQKVDGDGRVFVWKYVGDEVLFYIPIEKLDTLNNQYMPSLHSALCEIDKEMSNASKDDEVRLYVKGNTWIAHVRRDPTGTSVDVDCQDTAPSSKAENIIFPTILNDGSSPMDFLGPDIDAGFRIAGHSVRKTMVVSAELAYLVWEHGLSDVRQSLRVADMRPLKGIWEERHYPIVWYRNDWQNVRDSFQYDEPYKVPIIKRAFAAKPMAAEMLRVPLESNDRLDEVHKLKRLLTTESTKLQGMINWLLESAKPTAIAVP